MTRLPHGVPLPSAELHAAWEPTKRRLVREDRENDLRVRVHRACKALELAERLDADGERGTEDAALVFRWVALNALYGRWDEASGMPTKDRTALDEFTSECVRHDRERMGAALEPVLELGRELVESSFLHARFWQDGEWDAVRPRKGKGRQLLEAKREGRYGAALHQVLIVAYFLRCQIVHGGATLGSEVNRVTVVPAAQVLRLVVPQLTAIVIEHGLDMAWGEICYPPVRVAD
jgi:hypothetical protein